MNALPVAVWAAITPAAPAADANSLPPSVARTVDFGRDIRPLLDQHCVKCHGPEKQKGGLRLDERSAVLRGGDDGVVLVPGDSGASKLIRLVAGIEADQVMPPKGERLTPEQVGLLRAWIDQGVSWANPAIASTTPDNRHWSLRPIRASEPPPVWNREWSRNAVDRFILAKLEANGLEPAPEVDRPALIRRLSFDLLGLPPTPAEIDAFVGDVKPEAYERLVDRLLASPHYGERWARHWLDVARYTESQGFEYDHPRDHAWHYRDYVVNAFNADKPYDQFMREQIAGDVLEPVTHEGIIATSLLVCGAWDQAGNGQANATQRQLTREDEVEDMISVVGQGFLGLTLNCARCHSHKFDPIPQAEYYRIKAVLDGVRHGERPIATPEEIRSHEKRVAPLKEEIVRLERKLAESEAEDRESRAQFTNSLARTREAINAVPAFPVSYAGTRRQPDPTHRLNRGDVTKPAELVTPGALSAIAELDDDFGLAADAPEAERRRRFADWLADPRNPLPARVMVNRLWQHHFGQALVATPSDFGVAGAKPSHPELLDWLAARFIASGWSVKAMHRLIVTSATYRQASSVAQGKREDGKSGKRDDPPRPPSRLSVFPSSAPPSPRGPEVDADDALLWRFPPQRLEAEVLRDAMLAVSSELNPQLGGPSMRPFDTKDFNATFYFPVDKPGAEFSRRTIYRMNVNSGKDPLLDSFDCPDPSVKSPRRGITTTPLQALGLMNNRFVQRQAAALAAVATQEAGGDPQDAIGRAYRRCLGRLPTPDELDRAGSVARESGLANVCWALLNSTEFLYVR